MPQTTEPRYTSEPKVLAKVGKWRGVNLSREVLKRVAKNFAALAEHGQYPKLLLGHDREHRAARALGFKMVDGWPDLGRVAKMWFDEATGKLMGVLDNMPKRLADAIEAGLYSDVSIEIEPAYTDDVDHVERFDVMRFLGVLGVQWPGVKEMGTHLAVASESFTDELTAWQFGEDTIETRSIRLSETEDTDDEGGDNDMAENEKLTALEQEVADLKAKLEAKEQEFEGTATLTSDLLAQFGVESVTDLPEAIKKLKEQAEADREFVELARKAEAEAKDKARLDRIEAALDEAAKEGRVTAGEVETERAVMADMDFEATKYTFADDDGNDVEGTELDRYLAALKRRAPRIAMSDVALDDDHAENAHEKPKGEPEVDPLVRKATEAMGYKIGEDGTAVDPAETPDE